MNGSGAFQLTEKARRNLAILAVAVIIVVASIPLFCSYMVVGHDLHFHLYRIEGLANALADGQFPVRMQYTQIFGYGYPVSICYGDLFLYLPALLVLTGVSVVRAYTVFALLANVATAVVAYLCLKRIFTVRSVAVTGCALWMLAPYRLVNLYVRCAVGEYLAMIFLPLIVLGVYLVFARGREGGRWGWLWCTIGITGVLYAHMLTMAFVLVFCVVAVVIGLCFRRSRWIALQIAKCAGCTLLLSAAFVVPFLDFTATNHLQMSQYGLATQIEIFNHDSLQPAQLLMLAPPMDGKSRSLALGISADLPANVGWALLAGVVLWTALLVTGQLKHQNRFRFTVAVALLVASGMLMLLTTNIIPWDALPATGPLAGVSAAIVALQFTFRLLGPVSLMLVFLACMTLQELQERNARLGQLLAAGFVAFALVEGGVMNTSALATEPDRGIIFQLDRAESDLDEGVNAGVMTGEYLPDGARDQELPAVHGYDGVREYAVQGDGMDVVVTVDVGDEPGSVTIGRLAYAQYQLEPNADFEGTCALDEFNHTLVVRFGADSHGSVTVRFVVPVAWNVALFVTYATVLGLVAYVGVSRRRVRSQAS